MEEKANNPSSQSDADDKLKPWGAGSGEYPATEEGTSTLAAQFTRESVARIVKIIRRERQNGADEDTIVKMMEKHLADYDEHSREILRKLAWGGEIPDDFPKDIVVESTQPRTNTLDLKLSAMPSGVKLYSLVHYCGNEWLVVSADKLKVTLKLLN